MNEEDEEPILIRRAENTRNYDDPDNARYITAEKEEELAFLRFLNEKGKYSVIGLRRHLDAMKHYKE